MRLIRWIGWTFLLTLLLGATTPAAADTRVWVNTNSGVYHCPGTQYYGNTKHGEYLGEREAVADGYRAAYGQPCSTQDVQQARSSMRLQLQAGPTVGATMVWVNTNSHLYH